MANNAFTAGVRPGGLTTSTEIRILLCYLIKNATSPLSKSELENALLSEELVNYFELASNLSALCTQGLICYENEHYTILPAGEDVANTLASDVPRSVREAATRAVVRAQLFAQKSAQHQTEIIPCGDGYTVQCRIVDREREMFQLSLYMPDHLSAMLARDRFVENGDVLYAQVLKNLTQDNT
ncbi:DUF4364 family protein [uncultured Ruthenibacterium sp.]|uniref:DUF4364 family protein n=1 Tax=uncultured Ruthenibacterium sp. TaxID=1905347 RepID=UPI00349E803F